MEPTLAIGAVIAKAVGGKAVGLAFGEIRDRIANRTEDRVAKLAFEGAWDLHFSWLQGLDPSIKSFIVAATQTGVFDVEASNIAQGYPCSREFGFERVWHELEQASALAIANHSGYADGATSEQQIKPIAKIDARLHYVGFLSAIERHTYEALQIRGKNREHGQLVAEMKNIERRAIELEKRTADTLSTIRGLFIFAIVFVLAKQSLETALPILTHLQSSGFLDEMGAASVAGLVEGARRLLLVVGARNARPAAT